MRAAAALPVHQGKIKCGVRSRVAFLLSWLNFLHPFPGGNAFRVRTKKTITTVKKPRPEHIPHLIFPWCSRRAAAARICWLIPRPRLLDPAPNKRAPLVLPWCLGVLSGFFSFNSRDFPRAGAYGASRLTASMSDVSEEVADIRFKSRGCPRHMLGDQVSRRRRGVSLFRRPGIFASPIQHIS